MQEDGSSVRPPKVMNDRNLLPVDGLPDEQEAKEENVDDLRNKQVGEWEKLAKKFEELESKAVEHFNDKQEADKDHPPVLKAPEKMTREQREKHQVTNTPYSPACQHCVAARAVRADHPSKGRNVHVVPDIDGKLVGPTKVSLDYMYLHERHEKGHDSANNPPHLIMVEHKGGRVWAYRVPSKGASTDAAWLPKRIIQDWDNT